EKVWRAHRSHFYQYAARRFGSHAKVSRSVLYCNAALLIAALAAALTGRAAAALLTGGVAVGILRWYFAKVNGKTQHDG
ncbi:MAG: glycosyl transferase, partial [Alphaproteobacteria bacterium]|nr:glycosyl transferase [Alphaproteobacteria bacterium]